MKWLAVSHVASNDLNFLVVICPLCNFFLGWKLNFWPRITDGIISSLSYKSAVASILDVIYHFMFYLPHFAGNYPYIVIWGHYMNIITTIWEHDWINFPMRHEMTKDMTDHLITVCKKHLSIVSFLSWFHTPDYLKPPVKCLS